MQTAGSVTFAAVLLCCVWAWADPPALHDDRLQVTLFAEHPRIVTPIGMAVAPDDRIYVIESHTHVPPSDYEGPQTDRVKVFIDRDDDGVCDDSYTYADGLDAAMNLAISPAGVLYAVCARGVVALVDSTGDGRCDSKQQILHLETNERYPHNCLLGIAFGADGWLYVTRGNMGSRQYALKGTDGRQVQGYGDGGNVFRCRADGTRLELYATGFWNPFDLTFDHAGRLLCVDNDPDARGPNRLVHVVRHGDYGYRSLYGGGGNHPLQGWDGDLPGTLPYVSGTGEAPSGILDCRRAALPEEYEHSLLVTVWNENTIERHALRPMGASLSAERTLWMSGDKQFRPVAIDTDSRGNIYITDWVKVDYPNHGHGRIWRISAKPGQSTSQPRPLFSRCKPDRKQSRFERILEVGRPEALPLVVEALRSDDSFLRHAGVVALARPVFHDAIGRLAESQSPRVRLGCLLAARRSEWEGAESLAATSLADDDENVRRAALVWVGQERLASLAGEIEQAIRRPNVSGELFETYLAAMQMLDPRFIDDYDRRAKDRARDIVRPLSDDPLLCLAEDPSLPIEVCALAVSRLRHPEQPATTVRLLSWAAEPAGPLQTAALRQLRYVQTPDVREFLVAVATDPGRETPVRADALVALSYFAAAGSPAVIALLDDEHPMIRVEAARALRGSRDDAAVRSALDRRLRAIDSRSDDVALREELQLMLGLKSTDRPATLDDWTERLADGGAADAGRRVFDSSHTECSKCHTIDGRGGTLGPDLSNLGQSLDRARIVQSILRPSDAFAPQYQAWVVVTDDGLQHIGLQLDHKSGGDIELITSDGKKVHFRADEIEDYAATPHSLMPSGLESTMTATALADLVAYLSALGRRQ